MYSSMAQSPWYAMHCSKAPTNTQPYALEQEHKQRWRWAARKKNIGDKSICFLFFLSCWMLLFILLLYSAQYKLFALFTQLNDISHSSLRTTFHFASFHLVHHNFVWNVRLVSATFSNSLTAWLLVMLFQRSLGNVMNIESAINWCMNGCCRLHPSNLH